MALFAKPDSSLALTGSLPASNFPAAATPLLAFGNLPPADLLQALSSGFALTASNLDE